MNRLLLFVFLALICMTRSAPPQSSTSRVLILPDYHEGDDENLHDVIKPQEDETIVDEDEEGDDDDDDDETTTTTTTTTTARRSTFVFPTRNRNLIPSRRPIQTQRTSSIRTTTTTTIATNDDDDENTDNTYDGDFKYIQNFRKYFQKLLEDIRKLVRNLTGYDFLNSKQQQQYNQDEDN